MDAPAAVLHRFARLADMLGACRETETRLFLADDWLRAGWLALTAALAPRVAKDDPAAGRYATLRLAERFAVHEAAIAEGLRQAA